MQDRRAVVMANAGPLTPGTPPALSAGPLTSSNLNTSSKTLSMYGRKATLWIGIQPWGRSSQVGFPVSGKGQGSPGIH